jgi:hypothetical protein
MTALPAHAPARRKPTGREPTHGWTRSGQPVHARTKDHLPRNTPLQRFNSWLAIKVTDGVGTMWCAYAFAALAFVSLPEAIKSHSAVTLVSWISQTFLQLVLLSVIMVGQNVQSVASDARAAKSFDDVQALCHDMRVALDRLDTNTEGGLRTVLDAVNSLNPASS